VIHIATGLAVRDGRVLLVASRYANHPQPLWNLPGGRQLPRELLAATVAREVLEETGLHADVGALAYVSESYDGDLSVVNFTFRIEVGGNVMVRQAHHDTERDTEGTRSAGTEGDAPSVMVSLSNHDGENHVDTGSEDHVVTAEWVAIDALAERIVVAVVREPLLAYLRGELPRQYAGYHQAGITIEWPPESR
jgi:8-oxo-dGTP pyrophosphatase MutT (NUDIX family)